jgi:hypothetical protein
VKLANKFITNPWLVVVIKLIYLYIYVHSHYQEEWIIKHHMLFLYRNSMLNALLSR